LPAIVAYQWGIERIADYGRLWGRFGWLAAFFYAVAAALRLARFNARAASADKRYFEGLPSPSAAAAVASFVWLASEFDLGADRSTGGLPALVITFGITICIGALMVSRFSYWSGKELNVRGRIPWMYALLIPLGYVIVSLAPASLFALFGTYALSAPVVWAWRKLFKKKRIAESG
jgi:CDP-diacylglycerol--serine O-phosphatidyltransferase